MIQTFQKRRALGSWRTIVRIEKLLFFPPLDRRDEHRLGDPPGFATGGEQIESASLETLLLHMLQEPKMLAIAAVLKPILQHFEQTVTPAVDSRRAPACCR